MRLTSIQRFFSNLTIFTLLISGVIWLLIHYFTDFDSPFHFLSAWSLKFHGAASFGFLIVFGMIISTHISFNWRVKKNRRISGIVLLVFLVILILTGYGLYYFANENLREIMSALHWIIGVFCSGFFVVHLFGKTKYKKKLWLFFGFLDCSWLREILPQVLLARLQRTRSTSVQDDNYSCPRWL